MREKGVKEEQDLHVSPPFRVIIFKKRLEEQTFKLSIESRKCMPCGASKSLLVFHHSADYIFWSFGIIELMLVCSEYTILLRPALGGVM